MPAIGFGIAGSGVMIPRRVVPSAEVDTLTGLPAGTIARRFRIDQRYWADGDETSSAMAAHAAHAAIDEAGWGSDSIDAIIGACGVMEQPIPGTALLVQQRLGLGHSGIPAFDINATCLSFLLALDRALIGFAMGEWRRVIVFSADIASAALDFAEPEASAIFGDGAVAFALSAEGPHQRLAHRFSSYGHAADVCQLEAGGTRLRPHDDWDGFLARSRFRMDGHGVFRATAAPFPAFLDKLLTAADTDAANLSVIIPHQASAAALEHLKRAVPGGQERTVDIFARYGNQIATSMPHALHHARRDGRLQSGTTGMLIGTSAGVSLGGAIIRW